MSTHRIHILFQANFLPPEEEVPPSKEASELVLLHLPMQVPNQTLVDYFHDQPCPLKSCPLSANITPPLQQTYRFCNSLDWEEPLNQRLCTTNGACHVMPSVDNDLLHAKSFLDRYNHDFNLTVHYVFHEAGNENPGEIQNKRVNLEFFIQEALFKSPSSVQFYITYTGNLPSPDDYFASLGASPTLYRDSVIPSNMNNVHLIQRPAASSDLCQHGRWLASANLSTGLSNFVLLLNDGVRGPIVTSKYIHHVKETSSSSSFMEDAGVPVWFLPFLSKFSNNEHLTLLGPLMSSEIGVHVQSYAMALRLQSTELVKKVYHVLLRTCDMPKPLAVLEGELELSRLVLRKGLSLGAFFPASTNITAWHDVCAGWGGRMELSPPACTASVEESSIMALSSGCHSRLSIGFELFNRKQNPTMLFPGPVSSIVFTKFGGAVMRTQALPASLLHEVQTWTRRVLRNQTWIPLPVPLDVRDQVLHFSETTSPLMAKWLYTVVLEHIVGGAEYCRRRLEDKEKFEWMQAQVDGREIASWRAKENHLVSEMAQSVLSTFTLGRKFRRRRFQNAYWLSPHPFLYLLDSCSHQTQNGSGIPLPMVSQLG